MSEHMKHSAAENSPSTDATTEPSQDTRQSLHTGAAHMRPATDALYGERSHRDARGRYKKSSYVENDPYGLRRKRKHSKVFIIATALMVVGALFVLVGGIMWFVAQRGYSEQEKTNTELAAYTTLVTDADYDAEANPSGAPVVDWDGLEAINNDVVGWIQIPGTEINYPVYQGESNDDYLRTNAYGEYSVGGQIFLDYQNTAPGLVDGQSVVYGHHLQDGSMFMSVADMVDQDYFDTIDTVWYVTRNAAYELEPLFVYLTDGYDDEVRTFQFADAAELQTYLAERLEGASAKRADAEELLPNVQHVLTLVTCHYFFEQGRTACVCVVKSEVNLTDVAADGETSDAAAEGETDQAAEGEPAEAEGGE